MKKVVYILLAMTLIISLVPASVALAAKPGTDFNGEHYNLNLIGKDKVMPGDYDNPDRHTMFIPLDTSEEIIPLETPNQLGLTELPGIRINITQGDEFAMIDGNATNDSDGDGYLDGAFQIGAGKYNVYIAVKAKSPKYDDPYTDIAGWVEGYDTVGDLWYYLNIGAVSVKKNGSWTDATGLFFVNDSEDPFGIVGAEDMWVFEYMTALDAPIYDDDGNLLYDLDDLLYFWQLDNHGNKLIQVRFYPIN